MSLINAQQLQVALTLNQMVPDEGPKAIPINLDFSGTDTQQLDIEMLQLQNRFSLIQTLYVDMSGAPSAITITIGGSNQVIVAKPNTQGYYNVLCPNPARITFKGTQGQGVVPVFVINTPIPGHVWPTT